MKNLTLLSWLTQLGLSVALPLAGFVFLGLWLHNQFGWGDWVLWAGIILGLISAIDGLRQSLKVLLKLSKEKKDAPPVSFNDHE